MAKTKSEPIIDGDIYALEFFIDARGDYITPQLKIREKSFGSNDDSSYNYPYANWLSSFVISAQGDKNTGGDLDRNYLYGISVSASISGFSSGFEKPAQAWKKAAKYVANFRAKNPEPKTFGDYAIMMAKAFGFKYFLFEELNGKYSRLELLAGGEHMDRLIKEKCPHITRLGGW